MKVAPWHIVVVMLSGWIHREQQKVIDYLREENKVLREQLGGGRIWFSDDQRRRLAAKGRELGSKTLKDLGCIVTPDTILRWYRKLIAKKYDGTLRRGPGRPGKAGEVCDLVVRMAKENPSWGYTRIRDAMGNLGHEIGRTTVQKILKENGIEPAPERRKRTSWKAFLKSHWEALAACDFFTVEVLTLGGMTRYHVFFVMELATRRVEIAGIVHQPHGEWMIQVARNLVDYVDGFLNDKKYLILDRDPLFTAQFRKTLRQESVESVRLPSRSPNLNAFAERFVRSIKHECLDKMILFSEESLPYVIREYMEHYNKERNHQGLGSRIIYPQFEVGAGGIGRRQRIGGLLNYYCREAA